MNQTTAARPVEPVNRTMGAYEWGLIGVLSLLWGGSFFFVGVAVRELPPLTIVLCRVALASVILLSVVRLTGQSMPSDARIWSRFVVMGALNNLIPFSLIVWGQTRIDSGLASILNATTPIFSVVMAHFLTHQERLTPHRLIGVTTAWTGVAVLIGVGALRGMDGQLAGHLAVLAAAFAYACAAIYGKRFNGLRPLVVAAGMLVASTILMTPLALLVDRPWNLSPGGTTMAALIGLATLSTAVAYLIYFKVLAASGPTNILLVTLLIPVSAILLGALGLGERLAWNALLGMGLIGVGLLAVDGRLFRRFGRERDAGQGGTGAGTD